jgi:pimeloyl-ACP methyl ester carboxylesterase
MRFGLLISHRISLLLAAFALISCSAIPSPPRINILMANQQGNPLDPGPGFRRLDPTEYDNYIDGIFTGIASYCAERKPCQVLIYIHGGLNTYHESLKRSSQLQKRIQEADFYPIFVNWDSSLFSSWWDHVAHVHRGLWNANYRFLAPYFAAVDEIEGVAKAPAGLLTELRHTFPRTGEQSTLQEKAIHAYLNLIKDGLAGDPAVTVNDISAGHDVADNRRRSEKLLPYVWFPLTAISKSLVTPLVIQAAGGGAWDIMQRRTEMLFRTEGAFSGVQQDQATLAHFITRFQQDFLPQFCLTGKYAPPGTIVRSALAVPKQQEESSNSCEDRLQLTLIGHSMGAIIVDQLLRYAPNIQVRNIVFMAAAATVEDYRDTVHQYLRRQRELYPGKSPTQMYHLILHPTAEVFKEEWFGLPPRGSLLIWIDNYFSNPVTPLGRTVGRFLNLFPEIESTENDMLKDLHGQIHVKVFRFGRSCHCWNPQGHGDFGNFPFWDPNFWDPHAPTDDRAPYVRWDDKDCLAFGGQARCHDEP